MTDWRSALARLVPDFLNVRKTSEERYPSRQRVPWTGRTQAGVFIDPDRALCNATVWACVRYLSQTVGQLPWHVMRRTSPETSEIVSNSKIAYLLHTRPNPEWSGFQFRETLIGWACLRGNGYAEIERDAADRPKHLWPIHPDRVDPRRDANTQELFYRCDNGSGSYTDIPMKDMFHLRGFGDGPVGINVVQYAAQSVGWAKATELFGSSFFRNGITPEAILSFTGTLSVEGRQEALKAIRSDIKKHGMAVTDQSAKLERWSTDPEKAQFIETRQHQIEEICRWFGVPPHKVMHLLRATFSNIEHQSIEVVVDSVIPWVRRLESEADYKLFGQNRQGFFTKLNIAALLRGDTKARADYYRVLREIGVLNANEIRQLEDLNSMGAEGDKYVMQSQYTTLDRVGEDTAEPPSNEPPDGESEDAPDADLLAAAKRLKERLDAA